MAKFCPIFEKVAKNAKNYTKTKPFAETAYLGENRSSKKQPNGEIWPNCYKKWPKMKQLFDIKLLWRNLPFFIISQSGKLFQPILTNTLA